MSQRPTAFLFPGQGSQSLGMMAEFAAARPEVEATFREASDAVGFDLWGLAQKGPEAILNRTKNTQPVMLAADIASWRVWLAIDGPMPMAMAGHSLGEYAALVAAGAIDFPTAMRLVRRRGELMQDAVPVGEGAMAAVIGLDDEALEALCDLHAAGKIVSCANYNAPGQVVIAGHAAAVARVCDAALEAGARRAVKLPVSAPSHCALMREAAQEFGAELERVELRSPEVPIVHNADVGRHSEPDAIRTILRRQLWQPVRWTATIRHLVDTGIEGFAECGPGKVLTGLNRRIDRGPASTALEHLDAMQELKQEMTS